MSEDIFQDGQLLEEFLEDVRGTLGLTPPAFDEWRSADDLRGAILVLQAILEKAQRAQTDALASPDYRKAMRHILTIADDVLDEEAFR
jgi:hypothetical protein